MEHIIAEGVLLLGNSQTQQAESDDLTCESLGGGHTDFGSHMQVGAAIGGTGDARANDIADAIEEGPFLLGQLDGGQRIGRLATLTHGDDHIVRINDGVAVAELRGVLHLDRYLSRLLNKVLADESRVPRGATGTDNNTAGIDKLFLVVSDAAEDDIVTLGVQTAFDASAQSIGLLPDFLQHEVREATFLQLVEAQAQRVHLGGLVNVS